MHTMYVAPARRAMWTSTSTGAVVLVAALLAWSTLVGAQGDSGITDSDLFHSNLDDTSITVGDTFACALAAHDDISLRMGGRVKCWGRGVQPGATPSGTFVQLSAATGYVCALSAERRVSCWDPRGGNSDDPSSVEVQALLALLAPATNARDVLQLSAGRSVMCVVTTAQQVRCWGMDSFRQTLPPPGRFVQVSCGKSTCCAINVTGRVQCWGQHAWTMSPPTNGTAPSRFVQVSVADGARVCAVDDATRMFCAGIGFGDGRGTTLRLPGSFLATTVTTGLIATVTVEGRLSVMMTNRFAEYVNTTRAPSHRASVLELSSHGEHVCALVTEPAQPYDGVQARCFGPAADAITPPPFYPALY